MDGCKEVVNIVILLSGVKEGKRDRHHKVSLTPPPFFCFVFWFLRTFSWKSLKDREN